MQKWINNIIWGIICKKIDFVGFDRLSNGFDRRSFSSRDESEEFDRFVRIFLFSPSPCTLKVGQETIERRVTTPERTTWADELIKKIYFFFFYYYYSVARRATLFYFISFHFISRVYGYKHMNPSPLSCKTIEDRDTKGPGERSLMSRHLFPLVCYSSSSNAWHPFEEPFDLTRAKSPSSKQRNFVLDEVDGSSMTMTSQDDRLNSKKCLNRKSIWNILWKFVRAKIWRTMTKLRSGFCQLPRMVRSFLATVNRNPDLS